MRQTPAQKHFMHKAAARQSALERRADVHGETVGTAYELQRAQLHQHMRELKLIQSLEKKIEAKKRMLPDYEAYIDGVLSVRPGTQDEVIATVMVWSIDAGNFLRALELAKYMLDCKMALPDRYQRTLGALVQEEFAEAIIMGKAVGEEAHALALSVMEATATEDTPDPVKSKLSKAAGWALIGKTKVNDADIAALDPQQCSRALPFIEFAMKMDPKNAGVKRDIERLERRVKDKPVDPRSS